MPCRRTSGAADRLATVARVFRGCCHTTRSSRPISVEDRLIDTDGKVVGINIARALRVTTYAIPADVVQQFVAPLK